MGLITDLWDRQSRVQYQGHWYRTRPAYDTVLAVQRLYKDPELTDADKIGQALRMLVRSWRARHLPLRQQAELLSEVVKRQIELPKRPPSRHPQRVVDFNLDGEYIYASFLQAYGIDLLEEQGRLHWKKFIALFEGLPEGTKIREIMKIRGTELPAPTRYNQKQRQHLMELKAYYALPVEGGGGQEGLERLFRTLEAQAVRQ